MLGDKYLATARINMENRFRSMGGLTKQAQVELSEPSVPCLLSTRTVLNSKPHQSSDTTLSNFMDMAQKPCCSKSILLIKIRAKYAFTP